MMDGKAVVDSTETVPLSCKGSVNTLYGDGTSIQTISVTPPDLSAYNSTVIDIQALGADLSSVQNRRMLMSSGPSFLIDGQAVEQNGFEFPLQNPEDADPSLTDLDPNDLPPEFRDVIRSSNASHGSELESDSSIKCVSYQLDSNLRTAVLEHSTQNSLSSDQSLGGNLFSQLEDSSILYSTLDNNSILINGPELNDTIIDNSRGHFSMLPLKTPVSNLSSYAVQTNKQAAGGVPISVSNTSNIFNQQSMYHHYNASEVLPMSTSSPRKPQSVLFSGNRVLSQNATVSVPPICSPMAVNTQKTTAHRGATSRHMDDKVYQAVNVSSVYESTSVGPINRVGNLPLPYKSPHSFVPTGHHDTHSRQSSTADKNTVNAPINVELQAALHLKNLTPNVNIIPTRDRMPDPSNKATTFHNISSCSNVPQNKLLLESSSNKVSMPQKTFEYHEKQNKGVIVALPSNPDTNIKLNTQKKIVVQNSLTEGIEHTQVCNNTQPVLLDSQSFRNDLDGFSIQPNRNASQSACHSQLANIILTNEDFRLFSDMNIESLPSDTNISNSFLQQTEGHNQSNRKVEKDREQPVGMNKYHVSAARKGSCNTSSNQKQSETGNIYPSAVSVITAPDVAVSEINKTRSSTDLDINAIQFNSNLGEPLPHSQYDIINHSDIVVNSNVNEPQNLPITDINLGLMTSQDIFAANGIKTTFAGSQNNMTSEMGLSFTYHFDNSNLSSIDINSIEEEDNLLINNSTSFSDVTTKSCESLRKLSSSDLTFSYALKVNQGRKSEELTIDKLPLLQEHDVKKVVSEDFKQLEPVESMKKHENLQGGSKATSGSKKRKDMLVQEVSCLKCRLCSFLSLSRNDMNNHMKESHPEYMSESDDLEQEEPIPNNKRIKVFIPKTSNKKSTPSKTQNVIKTEKEISSKANKSSSAGARNININLNENVKSEKLDDKSVINISKLNFSPPNSSNLVDSRNEMRLKQMPNSAQSTDSDSSMTSNSKFQPIDVKNIKRERERKLPYAIFNAEAKTSSSSDSDDTESIKKEVQDAVVSHTSKKGPGRPKASKTQGIAKMKRNKGAINAEENLGERCDVDGCGLRLKVSTSMKYHRRCHNVVPPQKQLHTSESLEACPPFKCPECKLTTSLWRTMASHLWREHVIDIELQKCTLCEFRCYSLSRLLRYHFPSHSEERPFLCETCGKVFKIAHQLRAHKLIHTDRSSKLADLICQHCNKRFAEKRMLVHHMEVIHEKIKKFLCYYCGKAFGSKTTLNLHMRTHTGEKPFHCDTCSYSTSDHNSLRRHKMQHSNNRRYKCKYCDYTAIQAATYKAHLTMKHFDPATADGLLFSCDHCKYKSIKLDTFRSHLASQHSITLPPVYPVKTEDDSSSHSTTKADPEEDKIKDSTHHDPGSSSSSRSNKLLDSNTSEIKVKQRSRTISDNFPLSTKYTLLPGTEDESTIEIKPENEEKMSAKIPQPLATVNDIDSVIHHSLYNADNCGLVFDPSGVVPLVVREINFDEIASSGLTMNDGSTQFVIATNLDLEDSSGKGIALVNESGMSSDRGTDAVQKLYPGRTILLASSNVDVPTTADNVSNTSISVRNASLSDGGSKRSGQQVLKISFDSLNPAASTDGSSRVRGSSGTSNRVSEVGNEASSKKPRRGKLPEKTSDSTAHRKGVLSKECKSSSRTNSRRGVNASQRLVTESRSRGARDKESSLQPGTIFYTDSPLQ